MFRRVLGAAALAVVSLTAASAQDASGDKRSLSRRAQQVQTGAARGPQQERSVRAFLKAIQTIFHR
jgi:hypothetical protein